MISLVVTYIKFPICFGVMVDFGCRPQDHGGSAMRTAEGSAALGSCFSFFQNSHLLFLLLLEFTQKTGGYPPSDKKKICKLFVNEHKKEPLHGYATVLGAKYRALWHGQIGFDKLSCVCHNISKRKCAVACGGAKFAECCE